MISSSRAHICKGIYKRDSLDKHWHKHEVVEKN